MPWFGSKQQPEAERTKRFPVLRPIVLKPAELKRELVALERDVEIYTPQGVVEAKAGDLLVPWNDELYVIPPDKVPLDWALKTNNAG